MVSLECISSFLQLLNYDEAVLIDTCEGPRVLVTDKQTVCANVMPDEAYTHVLLVLRDQDDVPTTGMQSITLAGATCCATGTCP